MLPAFWQLDPNLNLRDLWPIVRTSSCENFKNDLSWLIVLRGLKVRASLRSWGYIDNPNCATCPRQETIEHCFLHCKRVRRVWSHYVPTLSSLLNQPFVPNIKSVFFCLLPNTGDTAKHITLYLIKTILYSIWSFRNKSTFHNGTETPRAIIKYINRELSTTLHMEQHRLTASKFECLWIHPAFCQIVQDTLVFHFT